MVGNLRLSRSQIAQIVGNDPEAIKQFESLIALVQGYLNDGMVDGLDVAIGNVFANVNANAAALQALADALNRTPPAVDLSALESRLAALDAIPPVLDLSRIEARLAGLEVSPPSAASSGASVAPITVTPGASPYTYINDTGYAADMIVRGGTVTLVEFGRAGVFTNAGVTAGMVRLSPFDSIRVTYAVAPTMTLVTR